MAIESAISLTMTNTAHADAAAQLENYLMGNPTEDQVVEMLINFTGDLGTLTYDALTIIALQNRQYPSSVSTGLKALYARFEAEHTKALQKAKSLDDYAKALRYEAFLNTLFELMPQISDSSKTAVLAPVSVPPSC